MLKTTLSAPGENKDGLVDIRDLLRLYATYSRTIGTSKSIRPWQALIIEDFVTRFIPSHGMKVVHNEINRNAPSLVEFLAKA